MFLFRNRFPRTTCYYRYYIFSRGILAFAALSSNGKSSLGPGIWNTLLTFRRRCLTIFVYFSLLLRVLMVDIEKNITLLNIISVNGVFVVPSIIAGALYYFIFTIKKNLFSKGESCYINRITLFFIMEGIFIKYFCGFFFLTMGFTIFGFWFNMFIVIGIVQVQCMLRNKNINFSVALIILITNLVLLTLTWWFPLSHIIIFQKLYNSLYCLSTWLCPGDITFHLNLTPVDSNAGSSSRSGGGGGAGGSSGGNNGGGGRSYTDFPRTHNNSSSNEESNSRYTIDQAVFDVQKEIDLCEQQVSKLKKDRTMTAFNRGLNDHIRSLPYQTPEMIRLQKANSDRNYEIGYIENPRTRNLITNAAWCNNYAAKVNNSSRLSDELEQFYANHPTWSRTVDTYVFDIQHAQYSRANLPELLAKRNEAIIIARQIATTVDNNNSLYPENRLTVPPKTRDAIRTLAQRQD